MSDDGTNTSNGHIKMEHHQTRHSNGPKTWTQEDMDVALEALRSQTMSLTKVNTIT